MEKFLELLQDAASQHVFNPWWEHDHAHDMDDRGPSIRRRQLLHYLRERENARYLLVAEALGYQGGHFTGIAMTSERIILGKMGHKSIRPEHVFSGIIGERTSNPVLKADGFTEPTATIAWGEIITAGFDPRDFVFWNAYPWHPYKPGQGLLSNRTPTDAELLHGGRVLKELLRRLGQVRIIAVGDKAKGQLAGMGLDVPKVRHPANGGATEFRRQLTSLLRKKWCGEGNMAD